MIEWTTSRRPGGDLPEIPLYKVRRHVGLNAGRPGGITLTTTSPDHIEGFRRRHPEFKTHKASIQFGLKDDLPEDDISTSSAARSAPDRSGLRLRDVDHPGDSERVNAHPELIAASAFPGGRRRPHLAARALPSKLMYGLS